MMSVARLPMCYLPISMVTLLYCGSSYGLSHGDAMLRHKRNTVFDHTNIVNVFLSELENNQKTKDIVFILDRSDSVGHKNFYLHEKALLARLIRQYFVIKPGDFNVAVITFARDVTTVIDYVSAGTPSPLKCDFVEKSHILDQVQYHDDADGAGGGAAGADQGADIRGAYRAAINILKNTKSPDNKQIVVTMTAAGFKDADAPGVELGELYLIPVFGVALGDQFSELKMRLATHYYSNFTYWKQRTQSTDYHVAYMKNPEYHSYSSDGCTCGAFGNCYCDVITGYSKCLCKPGTTMGPTGLCTACPQGSFKEKIGNEPCEACPREADVTLSPVGGTAYHSSCYCSFQGRWTQCPDHCRTNPFDPNSDKYCSAARRCVRTGTVYTPSTAHFTCECLPGKTGAFCNDDEKECNAQTCISGGTCVEGSNQVACLCPWGYTGQLCQIRIDECRNSNACPRNSKCHQREPGEYTCICDPGHTHPSCVHEDCLFKECGENGTVIGPKENPDVEKSSGAENSAFSGATKLLVIVLPPVAAAVVVLVVSIAALVTLRRRGRARREKDLSNVTETTSVISRNPSLITFDSKCYQDEGTPAVPNLSANFYDFDDSVYGNEPLQKGMDEWYAYVLALVHNNKLTRLTIIRLDGEKWVLSPGCRASLTETKTLFNVISSKVYSKQVTIQSREYGIVSNEDFVIVAHSLGNDAHDHEIACATKTRQFVVTATAMFKGDNGQCRRDVVQIREHIKQQGL